MYGFFPYKRPNTRECNENRSSDHYILDMTATEFPYVLQVSAPTRALSCVAVPHTMLYSSCYSRVS